MVTAEPGELGEQPMRRMSLSSIADEEGTDKGTVGPSEGWRAHNYTDIYSVYLDPLRDQTINFLEIGLGVEGPDWHAEIAQGRNAQGGASLRMWYRYLSNAKIFGIDINPASFLDNDRVTTAVVDQGDPGQLQNFLDRHQITTFDVIIDDGSHRPDHQQISFSSLFPCLAPGGLYFIEDLLDNGHGDRMDNRYSNHEFLNTRKVFREFGVSGRFPVPNALRCPEDIRGTIESVAFHCPAVVPTSGIRHLRAMLTGKRSGPRFVAGQEELCVIRKRAL